MTLSYVVGQWVRGDRFYGRATLLGEVLEGGRDRIWVAGMRRVGKTSLLRELERRAPRSSFVPVVWDLEGSDDPGELDHGLHDALLDAEARLGDAGVSPPGAPLPAAEAIARLAAALAGCGRRLLLLCDEAEELFALLRRHPEAAGPLERALAACGARVVLASSARLAGPSGPAASAGLLRAFGSPLWLGPLDPADARSLLLQERLPVERRPRLSEAEVELLAERCGGHPFLLQLAGKRAVELGDATAACEGLARDPTVAHLCAVDLDLLEEADREALAGLATANLRTGPDAERLARLHALGLVREGEAGRPEPGSWFLARHLAAG